jgi:hypothetical protein
MNPQKKFWLVLFGAILGMAIIACSCSSLVPTPTAAPQPISSPVPANNQGQGPMPGLVGQWLDPDSSGGGTISTIVYQNSEYVVTSVINTGRGPNELTKSSWSNGVLTWEYCPANMHCITQNTVSLNGDTLTVNWAWSDGGNSGTSDLTRK